MVVKYMLGTMVLIDAFMVGLLMGRLDWSGAAIFFLWFILHYAGYLCWNRN